MATLTSKTIVRVDEGNKLFNPRLIHPFSPLKIGMATLEQAPITTKTIKQSNTLPAGHFNPLMEQAFSDSVMAAAFDNDSPDSDSMPEIWQVIFRLCSEFELDEDFEEIKLDDNNDEAKLARSSETHDAFIASLLEPSTPPATEIETLLETHTAESENLSEQDITEPAIDQTTPPSPQSAEKHQTHGRTLLRSSPRVRDLSYAGVLAAGMQVETAQQGPLPVPAEVEASSQPVLYVNTHQHIRFQPTAPLPESTDAPEAAGTAEPVQEEVSENQRRQDRGLSPLKQSRERQEDSGRATETQSESTASTR